MEPQRRLGIFSVALLSIAAAFSVRNLPSMAVQGWPLIFWYLVGTLLFLVPLALTAAELASTWPRDGGVYDWVAEAFGERTGFLAVWAIVVQNLPWYPTVLAFTAVSLAYGFDPALQNNRLFVAVAMIAIFWMLTLVSLRGPLTAARFTAFGTLFGSIVPALALIVAGAAYVAAAKHIALAPPSLAALLPSWDAGTIPFVASLLVAFTGLEVSGYYALAVRNPQRDYPIAMLLALLAIAGLSIFATLAIALVVPANAISLSGGVVQTFAAIFGEFGVGWAAPVLAILTALGALALMCAWVVGPLLSLAAVARRGLLPPIFRRLSANQVPAAIMLWQGGVVTIIAAAFALLPDVNSAYWILTASVSALLAFYYVPIFAAVVRLRYTQPDTVRPFRIPGGTAGAWLVAGTGFIATTFAVFVGLTPPNNVKIVSGGAYVVLMTALALAWMLPWAVFLALRRPGWAELRSERGSAGPR